ncbi:FtsW/RodA/SpoVE family cell cycle protein [Metabacillus idriensis]|uniref:Probable peptidoglycan glycosyltransferase FtsW n=1 Tax=Metabacillus idriensis TaxID=324768 RepID=A0A6I2M812_9BACI|nr:FtsW/RodA/SpoVE family cell cycle protein [Metabacillus idriensis]MCM3594455.1 FtsW/RodA/SpoVE family cell cycle protein [Metabacillus idriensis]MRX53514.1 cell division protein FtsW [Metabacillus idriensis]OHR72958.1 cell division protein FtsW [Bacillus sp. HMSC76G11]
MIKKILKSYDYSLILAVILLCGFGLVMVYSSSMISAVARWGYTSDYFFQKQAIFIAIGFVVLLATMFFPYRAYLSPFFIRGVVMLSILMLLAIFVFGSVAGGARSWFSLFGFKVQPAEFVKLSVILYLAAVYEKKQSYIDHFGRGVLPPIIFTGFICVLIILQPDIGSASIIGMIALSMVLCSGLGMKNIFKLIILGLAGLAAISPLVLLKWDKIFTTERVSRFVGFMDPFGDAKDSGFHLINSYYAIGSGGLTGLGLGESVQKYGYLPESHTDFILAIISEELGIFGVAFVLILLAFIVLKGFHIARNCEDAFGTLLAIGISSMIGIQTAINVGGLTGLLPITGVTLPFISYGGSSMMLLMLSMGLLINISMFIKYRATYQKTEQKPVSETHSNTVPFQ